MLDAFKGQMVVVDMRSPFVCLGLLDSFDEHFLDMRKADLHDLRDTQSSRENYVAAAVSTGIKKNRRRVLLVRADVVAIARFEDVSFD